MTRKIPEKEITPHQVEEVFGDDLSMFKKIKKNVYCGRCVDNYVTTITDYRVYILANYDLILRGKCQKCGNAVVRVLETSEVEKYRRIIERISGMAGIP